MPEGGFEKPPPSLNRVKAKWGRESFLGLSCDRNNLLLTLLDSCLAQAWETNNKHFFVGKEVIFFKCLSIVPFCGIQARKHIIFSPPPKRVYVLDLTISITIRVSDKIVYQKKYKN